MKKNGSFNYEDNFAHSIKSGFLAFYYVDTEFITELRTELSKGNGAIKLATHL